MLTLMMLAMMLALMTRRAARAAPRRAAPHWLVCTLQAAKKEKKPAVEKQKVQAPNGGKGAGKATNKQGAKGVRR